MLNTVVYVSVCIFSCLSKEEIVKQVAKESMQPFRIRMIRGDVGFTNYRL